MTSKIWVIFRYFIIFFGLFNVNLKAHNYISKVSILFGNVMRRYISTSPKRKLRNNIDVIDYFAGDNEINEYAKMRCS